MVTGKAGDKIQTQINEINGQIEMVFDEQQDTDVDTPIKNLNLSTEGSVEYKIGDKFFSQSEIIEQLNNEDFVNSVKKEPQI